MKPNPKKLLKYLVSPQQILKFKRQCLKSKNILFENEMIQIGSKIQKLYDFHTSKNFVQINIFIGNKTNTPIDSYSLEFRGTNCLNVFLEDKNDKSIKEMTQGKQRLIVEWINEQNNKNKSEQNNKNEYINDKQMLLVLSLKCQLLPQLVIAVPLSVYSFLCPLPQVQKLIAHSLTPNELTEILKQKYQLLQQQEFVLNQSIFKKSIQKDLQKYFDKMVRLQGIDVCFAGVFMVNKVIDEIALLIQVQDGHRLKFTIAANQYHYFQAIFQALRFLIAK